MPAESASARPDRPGVGTPTPEPGAPGSDTHRLGGAMPEPVPYLCQYDPQHRLVWWAPEPRRARGWQCAELIGADMGLCRWPLGPDGAGQCPLHHPAEVRRA